MYFLPKIYSSPTSAGDEVVVVKTGACNLVGVVAENFSANNRWLQVFDDSAAPEAGDVPLMQLKLPASSQSAIDSSCINFLPMTNGIVIAMSSTGNSYTATGADEVFLTVFYAEK
jgi:hypothetical protein